MFVGSLLSTQILELAAAEQTIDHLQDKIAGERKKAKFLKQKLAVYEAKEADYRGAGEHMQELNERLKAAGQAQTRTVKKLALRGEQLRKTSGELEALKEVIEGGRGAGEDMVAQNKALKAKLEATLEALASKQVRKTHIFLHHLIVKTIILPRQARDKHRDSTQNRDGFVYRGGYVS